MTNSHQLLCSAFLQVRSAVALLSVLALVLQATLVSVGAQTAQDAVAQSSNAKVLSGDERALHVLNRLGFGARPTDLARVRTMGVDRYINEQLNPTQVEDRALEAKLRFFPALHMTTAELYAKYPQPNKLLRELQLRGELPADLKGLRENRTRTDTPQGKEAMPGEAVAGAKDQMQGVSREEYRRRIAEFYKENDLQPPQRMVAELQSSRILRAAYSERQLQEVMVDFWSNHFNIFAGKSADKWLLISYDRDTIRPNAITKFRDLLQATAQSPAMLFYLDNFQSVSPNAQDGNNRRGQGRRRAMMRDEMTGDGFGGARRARTREAGEADAMNMPQQEISEAMPQMPQQRRRAKRGINENYARELMELHTLGVDGGYTQNDIIEVARAFTGWTIVNPRGYSGFSNDKDGTFLFNPRLHDEGEKTVLGQRIPAGGGVKDGLMVLDILARHPSTARFIATKLSRRFVSDNTGPALIARIAETFTRTDGDIKETLRAIFTSPEFNSTDAYRVKIKTPFELMVSAIRALDAETDARPALHALLTRMGEPLYGYQAPTGYPDTAAAWVNTGALLERLNFALALTANRIPGTRVSLDRVLPDRTVLKGEQSKKQLAEKLLNKILHGQISQNTKQMLMKQVANPNSASTLSNAKNSDTATAAMSDAMMIRLNRRAQPNRRAQRGLMETASAMSADEAEVRRIIGLIIGTPEFQRQ